MLQPALLGGVVIGVLSALPVVNFVNICCCGWVLFGGGLAAYLMQQQRPQPISVGDGALVGLMAGAIGAVVSTVVSIPINAVMMPFQAGMLEQALSNGNDMPAEARAFLESLRGGTLAGVASVFAFMLSLVVFSVFGLIGGSSGRCSSRLHPRARAIPALRRGKRRLRFRSIRTRPCPRFGYPSSSPHPRCEESRD